MKKILETVLLFLAIGLCTLCTLQWIREATLRKTVEDQRHEDQKKREVIQGLESHVKRSDAEIQRIEGIRVELMALIATNKQEIAGLTKFSDGLQKEVDLQRARVDSFSNALTIANAATTAANENINRQKAQLKELAEQRNSLAERYGGVVTQYNALVEQFKAYQEQVAAAMTNSGKGSK